ncbi:MAG: peptidoglycan DD-metalloendopeptidase family protein [Pseudomonadota bacterium]
MALALALAGSAAAFADETREAALERERTQLTSRLARLRQETEATEARAATLSDTLVDLSADDATLRQRLATVSARIFDLETRMADDEAALDGLTREQAAIRHEIASRRDELGAVMMALQRMGRAPPPALFASNDGPADVVRSAILLNQMAGSLDEEAKALNKLLKDAARLAKDEAARWSSLTADLGSVQAERERLAGLLNELDQRRALSLYERDRANAELARLAEEAASVEALLNRALSGEIAIAAPQGQAFLARRGSLTDPVAGVVVGDYGSKLDAGGAAEGRIFAALPQSTVFAPMNASVLYAAPFRSYGHVLILDAGDGYHMVLTGLAQSFVAPGDVIAAGTPVGRMGAQRGRSAVVPAAETATALTRDRPLLYVELRQAGSAIDSHEWWRDRGPQGGRTSG